jgi:dTDP-4-amino-4,6-dideoxygalactose transaminase
VSETERRTDLAINGGPRLRSAPFRGRSECWHIGREERAAIDQLFDQAISSGASPGYHGAQEEAYCSEFARILGGGYADAVSSGTAALYVALHALEIEPYSEVVVGAITDPGGMMPVPLLNLIPVVADSAPGSYNTGAEQIRAEITSLTRAIVVAHVGGEPADVAAIAALARRRGIPLIEDCAQAHGAMLHGRAVGSFGDVAVFSTMYGKHVATGSQGGLIFTRSQEMYQAVRRAADRGKQFFGAPRSTNSLASLNFNLGEWSCAMGRAQLRQLPGFIRAGREVISGLADGIDGLASVSIPELVAGAVPNYWFLRLLVHEDRLACGKAEFCAALHAEGLPITATYDAALPHDMEWFVNRRVFGTGGLPWTSPDYAGDPDRQFPCPNARRALATHFNLLCHEHWTAGDVADAIAILAKVDAAYARR